MTAFTTATTNYPEGANTPIRRVKAPRAPNTTKNFILGDEWVDLDTGDIWKLSVDPGVGLEWILISPAAPTGLISLTGNSGGEVGPNLISGTINVIGVGSITTVGDPGANSITAQLTGLTNHSLLVGAGSATLTNLGVATNGQIPIGSSASDPVLATLTAGPGISIANSAGSITIASSGFDIAYTNVNSAASPYTVLSTDYYLSVDCSAGAVTLNFPNFPSTKQIWVVKDRMGSASTNNISVTTPGGTVTIDGQTTYKITSNYGAINILANATPTYEVF